MFTVSVLSIIRQLESLRVTQEPTNTSLPQRLWEGPGWQLQSSRVSTGVLQSLSSQGVLHHLVTTAYHKMLWKSCSVLWKQPKGLLAHIFQPQENCIDARYTCTNKLPDLASCGPLIFIKPAEKNIEQDWGKFWTESTHAVHLMTYNRKGDRCTVMQSSCTPCTVCLSN